jgi:hypothetical protein
MAAQKAGILPTGATLADLHRAGEIAVVCVSWRWRPMVAAGTSCDGHFISS